MGSHFRFPVWGPSVAQGTGVIPSWENWWGVKKGWGMVRDG